MQGDLSWPLARAARLHGRAEAVVHGDRRVTYAELAERVGRLGAALAELGVAPGSRFGVLAANSLAHLECWLGVPSFGRVLVDLNHRLAEDELVALVDDADVEVLLVDDERLEAGRALAARCVSVRALLYDGAGPAPPGCRSYEAALDAASPAGAPGVDPDALATISYTGGTTGRPKGVMLSHGNLLANAKHNLVITGHGAQDTFLHVCPMFHVAGVANLFASTWVGSRQVVLPRFDASGVAGAIERERVTLTTLVPTMLQMLLDHVERAPADLSSLRNLHYAASPISAPLQRRVVMELGCEIAQMYGMTEAAPTVTHLSPEAHRRGIAGEEPHATRLASIGVPVPGVETEIRDPLGAAVGTGDVGELWVRGPNVMPGYWRRPEATAAALAPDGWYRTGDAGYADADGYLYLVDRLKDMIVSGGENVYSIEVEQALLSHAAVAEAAVFGIPDARWGETVHATVVRAPGGTLERDELIAHCRERIAGFKVPRSLDLRDEPLPTSGAGKVLKNVLREPYWAGETRRIG
jgi:long-chain acyl-CoA synthetase